MKFRAGGNAGGAAGAGRARSAPSRPNSSARPAITKPKTKDHLLDDAVSILAALAQRAGLPRRSDAWRDRILQLASNLALEDALHAELNVPASERRRDLRRAADRLVRQARGGRRWGARIAMLDATALDVQKVWPDFDKDMLAKVSSPEDAERLASRLRRVDDALDRRVYGRAAGPTSPDLPLMMAAAGLADLMQEACGGAQGQSPPVSPGCPWALLLQRVSEMAGRPVKKGGRDVSHTLELVRAYTKVEPVPVRTKDTPRDQVLASPEPRPPRAIRPRRSQSG